MEKPDCYKCKHRGTVPGSAHICCEHPLNERLLENPELGFLAIFGSTGRISSIALAPKDLNIKADERAIKEGWFNYPWNFDPRWLKNCDGFEEVKK